MKRILGLDLGTNSIGWALIEQDFENKQGQILGLGSRIIPMSQDVLGDFGKGNSISQTAERTGYRSVRRLRERHLLRRERLHRILNILGFLPKHYASQIDFEKRLGQFFKETEPKLAWKQNDKDKFEFLFQRSFNEMVANFKANGQEIKIPYDWTIYYLRKKALTQKIEKEELVWIILNFNQKRGYYQLRGEEEEENPNKLVEFYSLKVTDVKADEEPNKKGEIWYSLILENGWVYRRSSKTDLSDWKDKVKDFIVTTDINDDGSVKTNKDGEEKRSFRAPKEDDWTLIKKKTEQEINQSRQTVGTYIYENLLQNPNQKIRGKLVRTIERKFYKDELRQILQRQIELQPELFTDDLYNDCVRELYRNNEAHQLQLSKRDFVHLFLNDIIFYQRPLKSQKSSIGNCPLEFRTFKDEDGNEQIVYLKAIPKSNPYYQEFRVWQWLYNLKIYTKEDDTDITVQFINGIESLENLFEFLMSRKEVNHKDILSYFIVPIIKEKFPDAKGKVLKNEISKEIGKYRWNYVYDTDKDESKNYPMNETGYEIRRRLGKVEGVPEDFLSREIEQHLWHIIYSVTDKIEYEKALRSFANKYALNEESFIENFKKFKPFDSGYGRYSEKAIKKLLPFLRIGKYWSWDAIDEKTKARIGKIITGEYDEEIKDRVREKAIRLTEENHFQGLQLWLAQYIVYDRHSEANVAGQWNSVTDLEQYLKDFKQHSLRNPIVEQVVTETLRVVKDIWKQYGKGAKNYFDEIHIELGRDMKNPADERKYLSSIISENENTNLRIKAILSELINDNSVENVRPYSPMQQEALKIYEDGVLNSGIAIPDEIEKISKKSEPTRSEIQRYKLWLEQKYRSPYTGKPIPLSKLFTSAYEIEHVIPQSRYFDDSFSNKVICEAEVNSLKDKQLGLEFIKNHYGQKVTTSSGEVEIFSEEAYTTFVKEHYDKNRGKKNKLLLDEIPEKMIERQLNDTRYISKYVSNLLSNIVRTEKGDEGINSKNIIPGNGKITGRLKQDWGLNDIWNDLILPRFERMNELTKSNNFTSWNEKYQKHLPTVPLELSRGFQKKRIDHRHHALDALVIACATRNHVNLLNNKHAKSKNERYDLQHTLRNKEKWQDKNGNERDKFTEFKKPWNNFTVDAKNELEKIVVSFKQNLRVINKATNYYEKIINGKKTKIEQKGLNWAIRKPMHKETVSGLVDLPRIKMPKGKILTATRKSLDMSFNSKNIESITDTGIQKILINHLEKYDEPKIEVEENDVSGKILKRKELIKKKKLIEHPELAFSPEGIEDMNKRITQYNDGKPHHPILKVRVFEVGSKFQVGYKGNKKDKYVEAAKGTNLFFAVYWDEKKQKRSYETIPLNIVIERQKQGLTSVPETDEKGNRLLFYISPNDLVYIPTEEEQENIGQIDFNNFSKEQVRNIYKMVSSTGAECHFVQSHIASLIKNYDAKTKIGEFGSLNKSEVNIENTTRIKEHCIKLKVDRLGNISRA
ncbi:type II CRISPR RNA-guided endonuclease Cas9 [Sinomicrobium soli]|uniref:type II CRISPR RNA-guided endonuclease Cas9 n=1 Tax=Sinomicrobium sp. N-1-3-6 TaxID=2219864 RepID=UPI000DCF3D81|nr:type II CRISPR RNA-guided endonuclease Cas9 [Sinomicrobium sp. N-1-3-6]RAV28239.1 type II CRISPR RNA-guided endonuclease Cas9 [Sinomicrobium sp. N-1-3-6]